MQVGGWGVVGWGGWVGVGGWCVGGVGGGGGAGGGGGTGRLEVEQDLALEGGRCFLWGGAPHLTQAPIPALQRIVSLYASSSPAAAVVLLDRCAAAGYTPCLGALLAAACVGLAAEREGLALDPAALAGQLDASVGRGRAGRGGRGVGARD